MKVTHQKVSTVQAQPANPAWIGGPDWNNPHTVVPVISAVNANGNISGVDVVEATGGGGGIALVLQSTPGTAQGPIYLMKVDNGAGAVTFTDSNGGNFIGPGGSVASLQLSNQGQWAIVIYDGTNWLVFGN